MSPVIYGVHMKETEYTVPDDIAELLVQKDEYALEKLPVSYLQKAVRDPNVMQNLINFALNIHTFRKGMTRCKVLLPLSLYEKVIHALQSIQPEKKLTLSKLLLAALLLGAKEAKLLSDAEIEQYTQDSVIYSTKRTFYVPQGFRKELFAKIRANGYMPSEYARDAIYRFMSDTSFKQNVISILSSLNIEKIPTDCGEKYPIYMTPQDYKKYREMLEQEGLFEKYGISRPTIVILLSHMHDNGLITSQEFFNYLARLTNAVHMNCQQQQESAQVLSNSASHQQSQSNNHHT